MCYNRKLFLLILSLWLSFFRILKHMVSLSALKLHGHDLDAP